MNDTTTPVERAAALYATALQESRGEQCSSEHFNVTSKADALDAVSKLLVLEGTPPDGAMELAKAGKLLSETKKRHHI
jgi:hypothetical protein